MKKGEDYEDAFAPVPRSTAVRTFFSLVTGGDMHAHKIDYTQAFIQGSWDNLPEGQHQVIYIWPPKGVEEDDDVVYQVMKPLY